MSAISFNIITKDQPDALQRCLDSVVDTVWCEGDEIVVLDTGSRPEELEKNRAIVEEFEGGRFLTAELAEDFVGPLQRWLPDRVEEFTKFYPDGKLILDFAAARNILLEESRNPLIFWLDTDDVLKDPVPGQLRACIDDLLNVDEPKVDALFMDYNYAFAEDGTCITRLRRERCFFRDRYYWAGKCHETAIPRQGIEMRNVAYVEALKSSVDHTDDRKPSQFSDLRNYVILRSELEDGGPDVVPDPRTIFYFGNACRGLGLFRDAVTLYKRFDRISGSKDDRFNTWYYIGSIYLDTYVRRPLDAIDAYWECVKIKPDDPRGYFGLARAYAGLKEWQVSLNWYKQGVERKVADTEVHSFDPTHVDYHPHTIACICARELEDKEKALEYAVAAYRSRPQYPSAQRLVQECQGFGAGQLLTESMGVIFGNLTNGGPNAARVARELAAELQAIPPALEKRGIGRCEPPDPRPEGPSLAIFCGHTQHSWGPHSRAEGVGGSEKMVLLIARQLQTRHGINVSVYANVEYPERGLDDDGVLWRHWSEFDNERPRDVFVAWRNPLALVGVQCPAKRRVVWNHDVQNMGRYTEEVMALVDDIQLQSAAHREGVEALPDDKVWQARNAIDNEGFSASKKKPKQVLFCSSPDRGVLTACEIVERARRIDPEISLVVTYGFPEWAREGWKHNPHPFIPDLGHEASISRYEQEVHQALDRIDATMLNKVGFDAMAQLQEESGVWLYPTRFLEISCMAAMEAQAHGCIPVATRHHALRETILPAAEPWELSTPPLPLAQYDAWLDQAAATLVKAVNVRANDPVRAQLAEQAWDKYNITDLGQQWADRLF